MTDRSLTMKKFIKLTGITAKVEEASENPNFDRKDSRMMNHYKVTLLLPGKRAAFYFSQGMAITRTPTAADLLSCLQMDGQSVQCYSIEEFISEFGYEQRALAGIAAYKATKKNDKKLRRFLGEHYDRLMEEVEYD